MRNTRPSPQQFVTPKRHLSPCLCGVDVDRCHYHISTLPARADVACSSVPTLSGALPVPTAGPMTIPNAGVPLNKAAASHRSLCPSCWQSVVIPADERIRRDNSRAAYLAALTSDRWPSCKYPWTQRKWFDDPTHNGGRAHAQQSVHTGVPGNGSHHCGHEADAFALPPLLP